MQIQHIDAILTSSESPAEGELAIVANELTEFQLQIIGTSGVWDTWLTPMAHCSDVSALEHLEVSPIPDDSTHVNLKVKLSQPDKRVKIRIYVLSQ